MTEVQGLSAAVLGNPISCPVLIGRHAELNALHLLIDRVKSGKGQMVLLSGEAGIGKSRLATGAKTYAAAQGFMLLEGQCFPADRSCPYAPLLDLLRSHFASQSISEIATELQPFAREFAQLIPDLIPPLTDAAPTPPLTPLEPEQEKRRLFEALTRWFSGLATKQPVLLIIEDVHWSDETSLDLLHYLARRCARFPLLVVLTYRSDEIHPSLRHFLAQLDRERLAQEFSLATLTQSEVSAMLYAIFALRRPVYTVPPLAQGDLLDALYALTEGNPFFIEELLKSLIEAGDIFYEQGRWERKELGELHIPRSVQDAVELRTAHLSEGARQVSRLAAVAGRHFDFALLQAITQHDEAQLLLLLNELIAAQLVVEESAERFAFRHVLTRQAVYGQLLVRERKALHRTIAETLERLYASTLDAALHLSLTPPASLYRARGLAVGGTRLLPDGGLLPAGTGPGTHPGRSSNPCPQPQPPGQLVPQCRATAGSAALSSGGAVDLSRALRSARQAGVSCGSPRLIQRLRWRLIPTTSRYRPT
jgi:predicted ATPase